MSTENPYRPGDATVHFGNRDEITLPPGQQRGMVAQVPIVGVLMMVLGGMELIAGLAAVALSVSLSVAFTELQNNPERNGPPQGFVTWVSAFYGGAAALLLVVGTLKALCGFRIFRFQGRLFGIVSLSTGLLTVITCYCFPTSLALAVYGLIVLLNQPVALAFQLGEQGYSADRIQQAFRQLGH